MSLRRFALALVALAGAFCAAPLLPDEAAKSRAATPAQESRLNVKHDLTPETLPALHALIRPHEGEWRHLRVGWMTDVVAARKKAAAEDKPIIILYTGGAGYNEPLGTC